MLFFIYGAKQVYSDPLLYTIMLTVPMNNINIYTHIDMDQLL